MKKIQLLFTLFLSIHLCAQDNLNMEIVGHLRTNASSNDVWGYVAPDGTEYALLGTQQATKLISLEDPTNPVMLDSIPGTFSVWRDLKVWEDHFFVTTDGNVTDGLLVVDASNINELEYKYINPIVTLPSGDQDTILNCHNIYIDEKGFAYLAGCNVGNQGIVILDVATDPWNPSFVGIEDRAYSHDVFVRDDLMYCSEIYLGEFSVYDITDRTNPVYLNGAETSTSFTHNAWISDDANYIFTTDERANAFVDAFDISDLDDPVRVDKFKPIETAGNEAIPHNTHYDDGYLVTSWYTDGVVITDANRPENMIKVGHYDTWLGEDGGFLGCWGAYPFLPSGLILASDRQSGLYVLQPSYTRAAYLEGNVTDAITGDPINEVTVTIIADQMNQKLTGATGDYKTGIATAGTYDVLFAHPDYNAKTVSATITNGDVTILDVQLGSIVSTEDLGVNDHIFITPNPFQATTQIDWGQAQYKDLIIYDVIGRQAQTLDVSQKQQINVGENLENGVYFIKLIGNDNSSTTRKLIKK